MQFLFLALTCGTAVLIVMLDIFWPSQFSIWRALAYFVMSLLWIGPELWSCLQGCPTEVREALLLINPNFPVIAGYAFFCAAMFVAVSRPTEPPPGS